MFDYLRVSPFTVSPLNTGSSTSICIELVIEFIRELDINVKILDYKDSWFEKI